MLFSTWAASDIDFRNVKSRELLRRRQMYGVKRSLTKTMLRRKWIPGRCRVRSNESPKKRYEELLKKKNPDTYCTDIKNQINKNCAKTG